MAATLDIRHILNSNPAWPRTNLGPLEDLTASIKEHGIKTPVLIKPDFLLIDGARRLVIAKNLGHTKVPVIICNTWDDVLKHLKPVKPDCLPMEWPDLISYWYTVLEPIYRQVRRYNAIQSRRKGDSPGTKAVYSNFILGLAEIYKSTPSAVKTLRDYIKRLETKRPLFPYFVEEIFTLLPTGEGARDLGQSKVLKMVVEHLVGGSYSEEKALDIFRRRMNGELVIYSSHDGGHRNSAPGNLVERITTVQSFDVVNSFTEMLENLARESNRFQKFSLSPSECDKLASQIKSATASITRMRRRLEQHALLGEKEEVDG